MDYVNFVFDIPLTLETISSSEILAKGAFSLFLPLFLCPSFPPINQMIPRKYMDIYEPFLKTILHLF